MFGEKIITNIFKQSLDSKNRFYLPKSVGAEYGDGLILLQEENFFSIHSEREFMNKIDNLDKEELVSLKDFLIVKKQYDEMFSNVLARTVVDRQGRIRLPQLVSQYYSLSDSVVLRGAGYYLNVFKDIDDAMDYGKKLKK